MVKVVNILENKTIFEGNTEELLEFTKKIAKENDDDNWSFIGYSDAVEYIEDYCDNLELIED